jgi:hypothetical protein
LYGALVLNVKLTATVPSLRTVRARSTTTARHTSCSSQICCPKNIRQTSSIRLVTTVLPKSTCAGAKLTLCAMPVAVTVVLPPLLLIVTLLEKLPAVAELNLTTTSCGCPGNKLKLAPETMLNGAGTLTVPVSVPPHRSRSQTTPASAE